jgi:hypothetical protein
MWKCSGAAHAEREMEHTSLPCKWCQTSARQTEAHGSGVIQYPSIHAPRPRHQPSRVDGPTPADGAGSQSADLEGMRWPHATLSGHEMSRITYGVTIKGVMCLVSWVSRICSGPSLGVRFGLDTGNAWKVSSGACMQPVSLETACAPPRTARTVLQARLTHKEPTHAWPNVQESHPGRSPPIIVGESVQLSGHGSWKLVRCIRQPLVIDMSREGMTRGIQLQHCALCCMGTHVSLAAAANQGRMVVVGSGQAQRTAQQLVVSSLSAWWT